MDFLFINYLVNDAPELPSRMGLAIPYLISFLKQNSDMKIATFDFISEGFRFKERYFQLEDRCISIIKERKPRFVGFNFFYEDINRVFLMFKRIKSVSEKTKIVVGGAIATIYPKELMQMCNQIDYCVIGEGEKPTMNLLRNKKVENIKGIAYRKKLGIKINNEVENIQNLNKLPFPDREAFNIKYYMNKQGYFNSRKRYLTILGSRGCYAKCTFCVHPAIGTKYRERSIKI